MLMCMARFAGNASTVRGGNVGLTATCGNTCVNAALLHEVQSLSVCVCVYVCVHELLHCTCHVVLVSVVSILSQVLSGIVMVVRTAMCGCIDLDSGTDSPGRYE